MCQKAFWIIIKKMDNNGKQYEAAGAVWGSGRSGIPYGWTVVEVTP